MERKQKTTKETKMKLTLIRQAVRKYMRDTLNANGINRNGFRREYKVIPNGEDWDGGFFTFNGAVNEMMKVGSGSWDIWLTCYDEWKEPPIDNCMCYEEFDIKQITERKSK